MASIKPNENHGASRQHSSDNSRNNAPWVTRAITGTIGGGGESSRRRRYRRRPEAGRAAVPPSLGPLANRLAAAGEQPEPGASASIERVRRRAIPEASAREEGAGGAGGGSGGANQRRGESHLFLALGVGGCSPLGRTCDSGRHPHRRHPWHSPEATAMGAKRSGGGESGVDAAAARTYREVVCCWCGVRGTGTWQRNEPNLNLLCLI